MKENTNITFQLHVNTGSARLKARLCEASQDNDKAVDECAYDENELALPDPDEQMYVNVGKMTYEHDPSGCKNFGNFLTDLFTTPKPSCMYSIGVIGLSSYMTHYGITVTHSENIHLLLHEGITIEDTLSQAEYRYYKIHINDDDIKSFTITLQTIHGDPDMYLGKDDLEQPTKEKHWRRSTWCGRFPDILEINKGDGEEALTGVYYLGVLGSSSSVYSVVYTTERAADDEDGNEETYQTPIQLSQDKVSRGVLRSSKAYQLYKFSVRDLPSDDDIVIALSPQNGNFAFTVMKERIPFVNEPGAQTGNLHNEYEVVFDLSEDVDLTTGTYYVNVTSVDSADLDESGMSYTFHISYSIGTHRKQLIDGSPSHGSVKPGFYSYFTYVYGPGEEDIVIRLTTIAGDPDIYMSTKTNAKYTTKENTEFVSLSSAKDDVLRISADDLPEKCKTVTEYDQFCAIHLSVTSSEQYETSKFTLTVNRDKEGEMTEVTNGVPQKDSIEEKSWKYYFFKTSGAKDSYAVLVPMYGDPNLYIKIVSDTNIAKSDVPRPTLDDYDVMSNDAIGADTALMDAAALDKCGNSCMLVIGVYSGDKSASYSLTVTREFVILQDGMVYSDQKLAYGNIKYFRYYNPC